MKRLIIVLLAIVMLLGSPSTTIAIDESFYSGNDIFYYNPDDTACTTNGASLPANLNIDAATKVVQSANANDMKVGYAIYDSNGKKLGGINESMQIKGASISKSLLLVAYLRQVGPGELSDVAKSHLKPMINDSSNTDANWVYDNLTNPSQTVTQLASTVGMKNFKITTKTDLYILGDSLITADDFAIFFSKIDTLIPEKHRVYALDVLAHRSSSLDYGFAKSGFAGPVYLKEGFKGETNGAAGPPFIINQGAQFTFNGNKYGITATIHDLKNTNAEKASTDGRKIIQNIGTALLSNTTSSGGTSTSTSSSGKFTAEQVRAFANQPITSTWNISDSAVEQWFLKQSGARATVSRYGLDSSNIGQITAVVKAANVSPVFFYLYTVNEGGGLGGFINHFGSETSGGGVGNAKRDAEYLDEYSKKTDLKPSWVDVGVSVRVDFVPQNIKQAGEADYKKMVPGSIGNIYIPATAAAAWEVYYPNGLKKEYNKVQDYGGPIGLSMINIQKLGGNPLEGGAALTSSGCNSGGVTGEGMAKGMSWARTIAQNEGYGYDQIPGRATGYVNWKKDPNCTNGCGSFDCSSFISAILTIAGYYTENPNFVANEDSAGAELAKVGFKKIATSATSIDNLQPGDILMQNRVHIEMYLGNNEMVGARKNEKGGIVGGQAGDQNGKEIAISPFNKDNKFDSVWRATR